MRSLARGVLAFLALVVVAPAAQAASRDARDRAAQKACLAGNPAKGVALLADLYVATDDPTYIFNQGRCFEQNSRYEDAIGRFREYLRKSENASAADRADAEKHIADCQALLGRRDPEPTTPKAELRGPPTDAVAPPSPTAVVPSPAEAVTTAPTASPSPETSGAGLRTAGVVTASVGLAALIGGVVLNVKYNNTIDDLHAHYNPSTDSSNQTIGT